MTAEHHDVARILDWIPPADRDRITALLYLGWGTQEAWTLAALAEACYNAGKARP